MQRHSILALLPCTSGDQRDNGTDQRRGYRLDILVEQSVIVELKVVERLSPIHAAQLLTYLKPSRDHVGLLLNFNARLLRDGFRRLVLDLPY
jgi:GxxExxY protein